MLKVRTKSKFDFDSWLDISGSTTAMAQKHLCDTPTSILKHYCHSCLNLNNAQTQKILLLLDTYLKN